MGVWGTFDASNREEFPLKKNSDDVLRCSFCNKSQNDVRKLIAGPSVCICDECVEVCNDIIADDARFAPRAGEPPLGAQREPVSVSPTSSVTMRCALCKLPVFASDALAI